jgi:hypothetical protein
MTNGQDISFKGVWTDEQRQFVSQSLDGLPWRERTASFGPYQLDLLRPVWLFERTTLRSGRAVYLVSSLACTIFAADPSLCRLLEKVQRALLDTTSPV